MNICFQSIFCKTVFFKAVADNLAQKGHRIFWVATSLKWCQWLIEEGVSPESILVLRHDESHAIDPNSTDSHALVSELEDRTGLTLKKIYFMDRVVSTWPWERAEKYMTYVVREITRFYRDNDIKVVLGEGTSCDEVLNALVCEVNGVNFYNPSTLRIPSERFAFFKGWRQVELESLGEDQVDDNLLNKVDEIRDDVVERSIKPNYWHSSNIAPALNMSFIAKIIDKIREATIEANTDATVKSLGYQLFHQRQYLKPLRYRLVKWANCFQKPVEGERFALLPLHKQPEASIDVMGAEHANQYELIKSIVRVLPRDMKLYVKEHANCLGDRSLAQLKRIRNLPGVRLIDPATDIHHLIRTCEIVLTNTGTVAFEAALHGKKAATFSPMYFNAFSNVHYLTSFADLPELIRADYNRGEFSGRDRKQMATFLINSHDGLISDPISTPACMEPENIRNVSDGCLKLVSSLEKEPGTKSVPC